MGWTCVYFYSKMLYHIKLYISYFEPKLNRLTRICSMLSVLYLGSAKALNTRLSIRRHAFRMQKARNSVFNCSRAF